jgi:hypothetical protein
MWIEDFSPYIESTRIFAIGWLERGHPYPMGEAPLEVFTKLKTLLVNPWQPAVAAGYHPCDLCLYEPEKAGTHNLFVPGEKCLYVTPELILHYINAHQYRPPDEFCEAVLQCPPMRSAEYRRTLATSAGPGLLRKLRALKSLNAVERESL